MVSWHRFTFITLFKYILRLLDSVYCISLQSPAATIKAMTANALTLDTVVQNLSIKHPLVSHFYIARVND
jgi:hypothetical protein